MTFPVSADFAEKYEAEALESAWQKRAKVAVAAEQEVTEPAEPAAEEES